jgi:hypothetical protein
MSMGTILKAEYIKTTRRFAFVMTTLFFVGMCLIINGSNWNDARRHAKPEMFSLPTAWPAIMSDPAEMSLVFLAVITILLMAAEFQWRTARQNVIDGLSKHEWFTAKLIVTLVLGVIFQLVVLAIGLGFALTAPYESFMRSTDAQLLGAYTIGMIAYGSMAFMLAITIRNAGPALGVFLLWISIAEHLIDGVLTKLNENWAKIGDYLPGKVIGEVVETRNWDPAAHEVAVALAKRFNRPIPEMPDMTLFVGLAILYTVLFYAASYVSYMKRDL